ncbi:MAG: hypothetical protein JW896_08900 [Deltaproteobacteria bacterium]|nr:hypothetical protein [Deltaproteobacteria bacterium]
MKTCSLSEFMQAIDPWLSKDYIHKVCLDAHAQLTLIYTDGGGDTYRIDDCTESQLTEILEKIQKMGVEIEFHKAIAH